MESPNQANCDDAHSQKTLPPTEPANSPVLECPLAINSPQEKASVEVISESSCKLIEIRPALKTGAPLDEKAK